MKKHFPLLKKSKVAYLDSAATTQKPKQVIDAITEFYEKHNANPHRGVYKLSEKATEILEDSRRKIAEFINAKPEEIIFVKSATEGFNNIANSLAPQIDRWNNITITEIEHHSNYVPWQTLSKRTDAQLRIVPFDKNKHELEDIKKTIDKRTKIFSITLMSNATGYKPDIHKIIEDIRNTSTKCWIILDATQYIAHEQLDVNEYDADFIVFSGHKLYGPMGTGVVWIRKEIQESINPFLYGGNMISKVKSKDSTWTEPPQKFEAGTIDVAGISGLAEAIKFLNKNKPEKLFQKEKELKEYTLKKLKETPHVEIIGHNTEDFGPIISIIITDVHPHDLASICSQENVAVRAGHHCTQPLMECLDISATTRISLSFYNEKKDIDRFIKAIEKARKKLGGYK